VKYWLMADPHLGHENVMVKACGRPEDYSNRILSALSKTVAPGDVFICLGDICFGKEIEWHTKMLGIPADGTLGALRPGVRRWLVIGNHDKKSISWYLDHGWDFAAESFTLEIFGHRILFSHVPKPDTGYTLNIHGHFHNTDHHNHEPELVAIKNDKQYLLVSENVSYQPMNLQTIIEKLPRR